MPPPNRIYKPSATPPAEAPVYTRPSRSAKKRAAQDAQDLGQELLNVAPSVLEAMGLSEELLEALATARRHKGHQAYRRSMQRVGALMRDVDLDEVRTYLKDHKAGTTRANERLQQVQRWRDALVEGVPGVMEEVLREVPSLDREELEGLVASAQTEREQKRPPRDFRVLFVRIRDAWV